jgi:hypothetical protein
MKRFVFPTALFALFIFCAASANAGKSRDKSRFHGAELLDDGRTVLFTYADSEYGYPSAPLVSFGAAARATFGTTRSSGSTIRNAVPSTFFSGSKRNPAPGDEAIS